MNFDRTLRRAERQPIWDESEARNFWDGLTTDQKRDFILTVANLQMGMAPEDLEPYVRKQWDDMTDPGIGEQLRTRIQRSGASYRENNLNAEK